MSQIPLPLAPYQTSLNVVKIVGNTTTITRLASMGVSPNTTIQTIQQADNNLIIGVNNSRIAISQGIAQKIIVTLA